MAFYVVEITEKRTVLVKAQDRKTACDHALNKSSSTQNSTISVSIFGEFVDDLAASCEFIIDVDLTED